MLFAGSSPHVFNGTQRFDETDSSDAIGDIRPVDRHAGAYAPPSLRRRTPGSRCRDSDSPPPAEPVCASPRPRSPARRSGTKPVRRRPPRDRHRRSLRPQSMRRQHARPLASPSRHPPVARRAHECERPLGRREPDGRGGCPEAPGDRVAAFARFRSRSPSPDRPARCPGSAYGTASVEATIRAHKACPAFRAFRVEYSVGRGSRGRAKAGDLDDSIWLFCIRPASEMCIDERLSLVLLVLAGSIRRRDRVEG